MKISSGNIRKRLLILSFVTVSLSSCTRAQSVFVNFRSPNIAYMGRMTKDTAVGIYWSGSSIQMNFEGTEVRALMKDEKGLNYFNVIIDGRRITRFKPDTIKQLYTLASGLKPGKHSLQLFKITECTMGNTLFYGFQLGGSNPVVLNPPSPPKRKIEFYGNSITSGYSVEDTTGDSGAGKYFNNFLSYAAITARHYNAAYHCISKSGIGVMVSWFPVIMPEIYDRLAPEDSLRKWDFSLYTPDIVVINLLQNDSWLVHMPEQPQFKARFGTTSPDEKYIVNAYRNFVAIIRGKYPGAAIICALGSMDATRDGSPWPGYIRQAVCELKDSNIYTHFFPYKNAQGHPKIKEQQVMAESLIRFIDQHVKW